MKKKFTVLILAVIMLFSSVPINANAAGTPYGTSRTGFGGYSPSYSSPARGIYRSQVGTSAQSRSMARISRSGLRRIASIRRGGKKVKNAIDKIKEVTDTVENMAPGQSPYANTSPGLEFVDNILTAVPTVSGFFKHPGADKIGTAAEKGQEIIRSRPVVDYIAENKHPIVDFMDYMTINMNWGITEMFGGDGDMYIKNLYANGYRPIGGNRDNYDWCKGQNWRDWRIHQLYLKYAQLIGAGKDAEAQAVLDRINSMKRDPSSMTPSGIDVKKPNIYLYPETETKITVTFDRAQLLTVSDPLYKNGWTVTALPDGTLSDENGEYGFLFYECLVNPAVFSLKEGFLVKAGSREQTYRRVLTAYGFNEQEICDFIEYWTAYLDKGADYVMYPLLTDEVNAVMPINYSVKPDSEFRLWFAFVPYDGRAVTEPKITSMKREGFTVVEWGGAVLA